MKQKIISKLRQMLLILSGTLLLFIVLLMFDSNALAQQSVFGPEVNIDQQKFLNKEYPLRKVLESGGQFFTVPYIPYDAETKSGDGAGEGPDGPRSVQQKVYYPYADIHFLKFNGLGAQSCFECHHSIGTYREPGTVSQAMLRKPGVIGGSAGFASNAYINPDFPHTLTELIRNPPHIFGTGYTQQLGTEMTYELQLEKHLAQTEAKAHPNIKQSVDLVAKNIDFGIFSTIYNSRTGNFEDDVSQVEGVAGDLVIRPFQWKGIASSVRHFVRDALDFHFSLQAEEKVGYLDCDKDGLPQPGDKTNEVTVGNVSALTSFVAMTRPPVQQIPQGEADIVNLGDKLFKEADCISCHVPEMRISSPSILIANPLPSPENIDSCPTEVSSLLNPLLSTESLEVIRQFNKDLTVLKDEEEPIKAFEALKRKSLPSKALGYVISLSPTRKDNLPAYVYPRLPENKDRSIEIPLYSDLKTHDMGEGLFDIVGQGADVEGITIPASQFLTRPLWGVGDTGPWLHDGRARTLKEAILLHASEGSEANDAIDKFQKLDSEQQNAIVEFLLSLRLPIVKGLKITNQLPPN